MKNRVFLIGRITHDLELKETKNGNTLCTFSLALNRPKDEGADFVKCVVWRKQAENLVTYQGKGSLVCVEGSIRQNEYTDREGKEQKSFEINVFDVTYLEKKSDKSESSGFTETDVKDEDLPF